MMISRAPPGALLFILAAKNITDITDTGTTPFVLQLQDNFPYYTIPIV
jgi:hypothetical protein